MTKIMRCIIFLAVMTCYGPPMIGQTTTADGSLPGGVDNSERTRAQSNPTVMKNMHLLKDAKLDPVALVRHADRLRAVQAKAPAIKAQLAFLTNAQGTELNPEEQVLAACLYARQNGLRAGDLLKEVEKGTPLPEAIQKVTKPAKGGPHLLAAEVVKTDEDVKSRLKTISEKIH
jgi:hypothetical protein